MFFKKYNFNKDIEIYSNNSYCIDSWNIRILFKCAARKSHFMKQRKLFQCDFFHFLSWGSPLPYWNIRSVFRGFHFMKYFRKYFFLFFFFFFCRIQEFFLISELGSSTSREQFWNFIFWGSNLFFEKKNWNVFFELAILEM